MSVCICRDDDGVSVFDQSRSPLSVARMSDDAQAKHFERHLERDCIRHQHGEIVSGEAFVLLLARFQSEFVRQKRADL